MNNMKRAVALSIALVAMLWTSGAFAQTASFGYVDLQQALNSVEDGVQAREQLEADFERRQEAIDEAQEELMEWAQNLQAGFEMLEPSAQQERAAEYQQRLMELQEMFQSHQIELAQAEAEATEEIFERMLVIIQEIAAERSYTMVFEKTESSILFAADGLDFTDELVSRYNDRH